MFQNDRVITISAGSNRNAIKWPLQSLYWSEMVEKLRTPARGTETIAEYLALPKSKQDALKDVGGYVAGIIRDGGRRKASAIEGRDILTLDLDNIQAGGTDEIIRRVRGLECGFCIYSTRKHSAAKPRLRVLIPTDRTVTADEYEPIARMTAELIGLEFCDPSTFEASRLMYWPSCCKDSDYIYEFEDKPFLSADGVLGIYTQRGYNWRDLRSWPQVPGTVDNHVRLAAKQGDPTQKNGIVGAFCRTFNIYSAMDTFLPSVYTPTDIADRYSYSAGTTTGGAVVYDNGQFLYSHHATDPCSGKLVNAFDLVRLHMFSDEDDTAEPDTPTNRLPSFTKMCELAVQNDAVSALLNQERYDTATKEFAGLADAAADSIEWMKRLTVNKNGEPAKTTDNVLIILENDPLIKDRIAYDEFAKRGIVVDTLPWDKSHTGRRTWTDNDDKGVRWYIERIYGITGKDKIDDAIGLCGTMHSFNEVKNYLTSLTWDGVPRLDRLFIDYLGAADTPYTKAVTRKSFVAAVARALNSGCKFDSMTILTGKQGIGKSTLLNKMGKQWFTDGLKTFEGKEACELIQGVWLVEVGELEAFNRSEVGRIKQFLSQRVDRFRAAYGRHVQECPRCCVFFGTSNNSEYLKDTTGGRRFWPIDLGVITPVKNVFRDLDDEIDQLWAEAAARWRLGEPLYLSGEVEEAARTEQESHREHDTQEGLLIDFLAQKIPADWDDWDLPRRMMFWSGSEKSGSLNLVERDRVCALEIWCEALGRDMRNIKNSDSSYINGIIAMQPDWQRLNSAVRFGYCKKQRGFKRQQSQ